MRLILLAISRLAAYGQSILRLKSHTQTTSVRCHSREQGCASRGTMSLAHTQATSVRCHSREQGCLLPFAQAGVLCHWLTPKPHLFAAIRASKGTMPLVLCSNDWTLYRLGVGQHACPQLLGMSPVYNCSLPFAQAGTVRCHSREHWDYITGTLPTSTGLCPLLIAISRHIVPRIVTICDLAGT